MANDTPFGKLTKFSDLPTGARFQLPGQQAIWTKRDARTATYTTPFVRAMRVAADQPVVPEQASVADILNSWSKL